MSLALCLSNYTLIAFASPSYPSSLIFYFSPNLIRLSGSLDLLLFIFASPPAPLLKERGDYFNHA
jgi:hypothetical protein